MDDSTSRPTIRAAAVIVAAGSSQRMGVLAGAPDADGRALRKPFFVLEGRTVLEHVCAAFDRSRHVAEIVLVGHPEDVERLQQMAASIRALRKVRAEVQGGDSRFDSVRAGVAACSVASEIVAIHDCARPLVTPRLIDRCIETANEQGAALVAVPVSDTIKTSSTGRYAESTLDRSVLWRAQTPQAFRARRLRELYDRAAADRYRPTDDAALWERYVGQVAIVQGDEHNLKLTTPEDLMLAAAVLRARRREEADA